MKSTISFYFYMNHVSHLNIACKKNNKILYQMNAWLVGEVVITIKENY